MRNFETYCKDYEKAKKDDFKGGAAIIEKVSLYQCFSQNRSHFIYNNSIINISEENK